MHSDKDFKFEEQRKILECIFQYFFISSLNYSKKELLNYYLDNDFSHKTINNFIKIINHENTCKEYIEKNLKFWKYYRLNNFEKSLLLFGTYYLLNYKQISSKLVIWFCIKNAKEYCGDNSYKMINGVLDKISKI